MNDTAQTAPISVLMIATIVLIFESVLYSGALVQGSIISDVPYQICSAGSGFGAQIGWIACNAANFFVFIINIFLVIFSVVAFFFNAITFNVPDAPSYIRVLIATLFIGSIGWAIASLFRGTKA